MAYRFLWFGTKAAVFTGAVYYTANVGLWKDSSNTEKLYGEIYKTVAPYVKDLPIEVPEIPKMGDASRAGKQYWNRGVIVTTDFLINLPNHVMTWAASANHYISEQINSTENKSQ